MILWIEAESFRERGGWIVDTLAMEQIGSAFLTAHGMGRPVADAVTEIDLPEGGDLTLYALTRDWTAVWNAAEPAGRFTVKLDGRELPTVLGTNGAAWGWQKAGTVPLAAGRHTLALHDLTGFNGRCDALLLTNEGLPDGSAAELRRKYGWKTVTDDAADYGLIVVGGGVAGICTALSAARSGVKTLLLHDRDVPGGCNSSEVRVCMGGEIKLPPYPEIGNVVREIAPIMGSPQLYDAALYEDDRKRFALQYCGGLAVRYHSAVTDVETDGDRIAAVVATDVYTGQKTRYRAQLFADCSGDGILARRSGCETMSGRDARDVFGESLAPVEAEQIVMGHSIRWYSAEEETESGFPDIDWGLSFDDATCLDVVSGDWEQETGFRRDMVNEGEYIRDFGLRAIYSNWSYQKNRFAGKDKYAKRRLVWVSPIGGKRESIRVVGRHIITQNDIEDRVAYDDGAVCITWSIDMHFPEPDNVAQFGEAFRSYAYHRGIVKPYPIPYRCLVARDCANLFLGGRIVSSSHVAFSAIRVMRTLGELGEVAGLAAGIAVRHGCTPYEVYTDHLGELKEAMTRGVPIPTAFGCGCGSEEAYHFKDIGWLRLAPYRCDSPDRLDKFRRGIDALGIDHKYPLPEELTK